MNMSIQLDGFAHVYVYDVWCVHPQHAYTQIKDTRMIISDAGLAQLKAYKYQACFPNYTVSRVLSLSCYRSLFLSCTVALSFILITHALRIYYKERSLILVFSFMMCCICCLCICSSSCVYHLFSVFFRRMWTKMSNTHTNTLSLFTSLVGCIYTARQFPQHLLVEQSNWLCSNVDRSQYDHTFGYEMPPQWLYFPILSFSCLTLFLCVCLFVSRGIYVCMYIVHTLKIHFTYKYIYTCECYI